MNEFWNQNWRVCPVVIADKLQLRVCPCVDVMEVTDWKVKSWNLQWLHSADTVSLRTNRVGHSSGWLGGRKPFNGEASTYTLSTLSECQSVPFRFSSDQEVRAPTSAIRLRILSHSAKLHYTATGYGHVIQHHQRTKICHITMPKPNISTCQDVGMWQIFVRWWWICSTTSCRIVASSSVGGVVQHVCSRCPCSGVWHLCAIIWRVAAALPLHFRCHIRFRPKVMEHFSALLSVSAESEIPLSVDLYY